MKKKQNQNQTSSNGNNWFRDNAKFRALVQGAKKGLFRGALQDPNIVGLSYGRRDAHGERTEDPALVVYVGKKMPRRFLPPSRLLPRKVYIGGDCLEVDVVETGFFYAHSFTTRDRPAESGISIGNANEASAGTLGCLVTDNTDGSLNILSNNHVLARHNAAGIGENIVQPGIFDGGSAARDVIARLNRFVTLGATGNTVDGAIARVNNASDVVNLMKNNLMPIANASHPAVGLLYAGGCSRTLMNPIDEVLNQLNISFPGAATSAPIVPAEVGMNVEKVGRTTEYTTSTVTEIDVTVTINYNFGPAQFDNQIATAWMSDSGDSGSLICRGGDGGNENQCGGCASTSSAAKALGKNVETEGRLAREWRDNYLRHTKIGRWAIDLFYRNEEYANDRFNTTDIDDGDIQYARKLFDKYREEARCAASCPESTEVTFTQNHLREAQSALKRASRYLSAAENDAAHRLLKIAEERLIGKGVRELLSTLQDEKLLEELQAVADSVPTVVTKDCGC